MEKILNSFFKLFKKKNPPDALRKSAGKVEIPNKSIPNPAISGEEIEAVSKKALYKSPQGIKPRINPKKNPFKPFGFLNKNAKIFCKRIIFKEEISKVFDLNGNLFFIFESAILRKFFSKKSPKKVSEAMNKNVAEIT